MRCERSYNRDQMTEHSNNIIAHTWLWSFFLPFMAIHTSMRTQFLQWSGPASLCGFPQLPLILQQENGSTMVCHRRRLPLLSIDNNSLLRSKRRKNELGDWERMKRNWIGDGVCQDNMHGCYNRALCEWDGDNCGDSEYKNCGHDGFACRNPTSDNCDSNYTQKCPANHSHKSSNSNIVW
jgi:hypothetical protein